MNECNNKSPYPEIMVEEKNNDYAYLLLEDYAGVTSELSAICLYVYQHIINEDTNELFAKMLKGIFISEMRHLEMLGNTIRLLGVKPIYKTITNNELKPWNSNYVNYEINIEEQLLINIENEEKAITQYKKHIELISDKYIKELLKRIILDEEKHIECFNNLLKETKK